MSIKRYSVDIWSQDDENGEYVSYTAHAPACKTCGGSKWVTPKANGAIDMGIVSGDPRPCPDCNPAGEKA